MNRARKILIYVGPHLMTGDAKFLGVGELEGGVGGAPEDHAPNEAAECQKGEAERCGRRNQDLPRVAEARRDARLGIFRDDVRL